MSNRRRFLATLAGAAGAAAACAPEAEGSDPLVDALRDLNDAAGVGISAADFDAAKDYAAGAYREAQSKLRPIALPESMDLPIAFSAKRGGR